MLHESTRRLIAKLCEMTERAEIAWREPPDASAAGRSRFETEGYVVEVQAEPPDVRVMRADGRELERATAADLAGVNWDAGEGTFADAVRRMGQRADRIASGAERAIETILSALSAPPAPRSAEAAPETTSAAAPPADAQDPVANDSASRAAPLIALTRSPNAERFGGSFGAVNSFSRNAPPTEPARPAPSLLQTGISAVTRQTTDGRPAPQPAPASVYKPWV